MEQRYSLRCRKSVIAFFLLVLALSGIQPARAQLNVVSGVSAASLISNLVGQGLTVSNVVINCPTNAYGTFSNGNTTNLGLTNGILLTTGSCATAIGPNNSPSAGVCNNTSASDPQLTAIEPQAIYDPCIIEFDVVPQCNNLQIRFVFGSEEYPEFVNASFNDAFGLFITGPSSGSCPGGTYNNTNVATLPNNTTPVSIDNVNSGLNSAYYVDNTGGATIQYDGFTTVLTRNITLCPCLSYHWKLAIADAGDCIYDSGVFIDFLSCSTALTVTGSSTPSGCSGCSGTATATAAGPGPFTYSWSPGGQTTATATNLCPGTYTCTVNDAIVCSPSQTVAVTVGSSSSVLTVAPSHTNVTCNGGCNGTATASVTGGSPPITYNWTPAPGGGQGTATATGLCPGTYTCNISDNAGCSTSQTFTITQPPPLTVSTSATTSTCGSSNGSVTATGGGGAGGYSYLWSPGGYTTSTVNSLPAGTYNVTVTDANGCTTTGSATVNSSSSIASSNSVTNVLCNGATTGSATVTVTGNNGSVSYAWAPSVSTTNTASNIGAGTYVVTATDAMGCVTTTTVTITQPPALTASASSTATTCGNTNGTLSSNGTGGTGPYTYAWSPGGYTTSNVSSVGSGAYNVTVTDSHGCTATASTNVGASTAISASNSVTNVLCNGGSTGSATVTVTGNNGSVSYSWSPNVSTTNTASNLSAGNYVVTATDATGCTATTTVTITQPTALSASASSTPATCGNNNGTLSSNGTGGTGPYTYAWSPGGYTTANVSSVGAGTYNVTVTDNHGCTATASTTVASSTAMSSSNSVTNVLCNGATTGSATVTVTGNNGSVSYAWAPSVSTTNTASGIGAGSYVVTATDASGCTSTTTVTITQPPALTASASSTATTCGNNNGTLSSNGTGGTGAYTYSWSPGGYTTSSVSSVASGTYNVTVTDANGCTATASTTVGASTAISASNSVTNVLCNGGTTGSATVTVTGNNGTVGYSWSPNVSSTNTASNLGAGSYVVTATDAAGCSTTTTVNITQPAALSASATSTPATCGNNNGTATGTGTGGTGSYSYLWVPGGNTTATISSLSPGSYNVTITDSNGCTSTASTTIASSTALGATTASTDVACFGGTTGTASISVTGANGTVGYTWTPNVSSTSSASNLAAGTYVVNATDATGCSTTQTITITEPPQLTLAAGGFNVTCFGACDGQLVVIPSGGTPNYTFSWSTGCTQPNCNSICAGNYNVTVTDANGCTSTASTTVTEPPAISITTSEVDAHCNQSDGSASANATGGTGTLNYAWLPSGSGSALNNIPAGNYSVIVTDQNGCDDTVGVTVNNLNGVTASLQTTVNATCFGSSDGSLTINATGGSPTYTYTWSPSPASSSTTNSASGLPAGNYQVVVTDAVGCTFTVNGIVTQPAQLTISATATPSVVCAGTPVQLSSTPAGGTPGYTVNWTPGGPGNSINVTPAASGTYSVDVTDANGCTATSTVNVTVDANPVAALAGDVLSGCAPLCVNFTDASTLASGTITSWSWNFGDGNTSTLQNPQHCYSTPGVYTVVLTVTTGGGCTNTITMSNYISVFINPIAGFTASPQPTTILNPTIYFTDTSQFANSWSWSFGDLANSSSTLQNPTFSYPDATCYQVIQYVTSIDGCVDSASMQVCLDPDVVIYVPNTFTPNADGTNDIFIPVCTGIDPEKYQLWIFDRWGNLIFYTEDLNKGWDGKVQGHENICQIDTYVWKIKAYDVLGKRHNLLGHVNLIK